MPNSMKKLTQNLNFQLSMKQFAQAQNKAPTAQPIEMTKAKIMCAHSPMDGVKIHSDKSAVLHTPTFSHVLE